MNAGAPRALLLGLTTSRGTRATRTRAELERLVGPAASPILAILEDRRLVEEHAGGITLTHEALISSWTTLKSWLAEEREQRLLAEDVERAAKAWSAEPTPALLWRKRRLEQAEELEKQASVGLSDEARAFLRAARSNERRRLVVTAAVVTAVLGAALAIGLSYLAAVRAEQGKAEAALAQEQKTRRVAEQRTREVQAAQSRIDELLKSVKDSREKEELLALQRTIRGADPAPTAERRVKAVAATVAAHAEPSAANPRPAAAKSAAPSSIKLQNEW